MAQGVSPRVVMETLGHSQVSLSIPKLVDGYLKPVADVTQHVVHHGPGLVINMHNCFALDPLNRSDERVNRRRWHAISIGESAWGK